jgi:hypothetical protein
VVTRRRGASRFGCLLVLIVIGVGVYYGLPLGKIYYRYYRYEDAFRQQARYGDQATDEEILKQLRATADTLELPDAARAIRIDRRPHHIAISAEYTEHWDAPYFGRDFPFYPDAENDF